MRKKFIIIAFILISSFLAATNQAHAQCTTTGTYPAITCSGSDTCDDGTIKNCIPNSYFHECRPNCIPKCPTDGSKCGQRIWDYTCMNYTDCPPCPTGQPSGPPQSPPPPPQCVDNGATTKVYVCLDANSNGIWDLGEEWIPLDDARIAGATLHYWGGSSGDKRVSTTQNTGLEYILASGDADGRSCPYNFFGYFVFNGLIPISSHGNISWTDYGSTIMSPTWAGDARCEFAHLYAKKNAAGTANKSFWDIGTNFAGDYAVFWFDLENIPAGYVKTSPVAYTGYSSTCVTGWWPISAVALCIKPAPTPTPTNAPVCADLTASNNAPSPGDTITLTCQKNASYTGTVTYDYSRIQKESASAPDPDPVPTPFAQGVAGTTTFTFPANSYGYYLFMCRVCAGAYCTSWQNPNAPTPPPSTPTLTPTPLASFSFANDYVPPEYISGGWQKEDLAMTKTTDGNGTLILIKQNVAVRTSHMLGMMYSAPAGYKIKRVEFDFDANYDKSLFVAGMDYPGKWMHWQVSTIGGGQHAALDVPSVDWVGFGLYPNGGPVASPFDNWHFRVKNVKIYF